MLYYESIFSNEIHFFHLTICFIIFACNKKNNTEQSISFFILRLFPIIIYIDVVIDKPALSEVDVLLVLNGTVLYDYNLIML